MVTCIGCYSIFVAWRVLMIHNITLPAVIVFNLKYIKVFAEHILLNFNSVINPFIYIINNRSIKLKTAGRKSKRRGSEGAIRLTIVSSAKNLS